ncbi:RsmB/NOP family class I SAM-dependent RNA methyltransferase [Candidatus Pacearchaeota archaeon]|nr:RsmB/NOP family class I SAM-dependent RNA methyltransferase [Candidatus Pacearchaeota archaeon]
MHKKLELKPAFVERMQKLLDKSDFEKYIKSLEEKPTVSFRCNTLKTSPYELKKRLEEKGWKISQPWKEYPEVFVVDGKLVSEENLYDNPTSKVNVNIKKDFDEEFLVEKGDKTNLHKKSIGLMGSRRRNLTKSVSEQHQSASDNEPTNGQAGGKVLVPLEPGELGRSLEHLLGYYYIQDLASMLPVLVLEPKPEEMVLDLCASPGSKTTQISSAMKNKGTIIANEVSLGRIKILASNLERCGCSNTIITRKDGIALCKRFKNAGIFFDRILVDAPCSCEGTLRSSPKTSLMWNPHTIKSLSKLQKSMVENALEILKPYGIIVYSTCTHAPEENEEVLNYILNKFPNVKIESIKLPIKTRPGVGGWEDRKFNPEVIKSCIIYPHDTGTEGFFVSKLKKIK